MSERQPRPPLMEFSVGQFNYHFTDSTGWGYQHKNPEHDHILIVTELDKDNKPSKADYLFRCVLKSQGLDIDSLFETMDRLSNDWVKGEKKLSEGELQALALAKKHNAVATFELGGKAPKLVMTPVDKKNIELPTYTLTHRMEQEIARLALTLRNMPDQDIQAEFNQPWQNPGYPQRWR